MNNLKYMEQFEKDIILPLIELGKQAETLMNIIELRKKVEIDE